MVTTLPPPLLLPLLLVVLSPGPGIVHCRDPVTGQCINPQIVLNKSDTQAIHTENAVTERVVNTTVYVYPLEGFEGVSLQANNQTGLYEVRFDNDDTCFTPNTWSELRATLELTYEQQYLRFLVQIGNCTKECTMRKSFDQLWNLTVVGHGPSDWALTLMPSQCDVRQVTESMSASWKFCQIPHYRNRTTTTTTTTPPPRTTTTTTTAPTTTTTTTPRPQANGPLAVVKVAVYVVVTVVMMGMLLMTILVVKQLYQDTPSKLAEVSKTSLPTEPASQTPAVQEDPLHVIENELYEPFQR